jgi:phage gp46-like protein
MQDLKIKQSSTGLFDLEIGEHDLSGVGGLETTVATLLFTDARAASSDVGEASKRRGWVGNILPGGELGSLIWLSEQLRNTQTTENLLRVWAENALSPLVVGGIASEIAVKVEKKEARKVSLQIEIFVRDSQRQDFQFWLLTDLGSLANGN